MRKSEKRPVLTSPWKIGMFVALMLVVTSFGVGYFLVSVYNVNLTWLDSSDSKWMVDSAGFFRETYPMVAGVIIIALIAYFTIASAVRRYKYYLSSGMDYRKMISLAGSIDDLTNPAQIGKLSDFPELQGILRNYGDQIREISAELSSRVDESKSIDLEMELESILNGKGMNESLIEGKWWESLIRKVASYVSEAGVTKDDRAEVGRQVIARAALSCGKWMESLSGSNEDILDIARAVGSLNSTVKQMENAGPDRQSAEAPDKDRTRAVTEIREALAILDGGSRTMNEFSEENNGLALNIALMAARGDISEKDLAGFAEKVRSTAERFNRLGMQISDTSKRIDTGLHALAFGTVSAAGSSPDSTGIVESLSKISNTIDAKSHSLQARVTSLGNEIDFFNEEIHKALSDDHMDESVEDDFVVGNDDKRESSGSFVAFAHGNESEIDDRDDSNDLVLDRSNSWVAQSTAENGAGDIHQAIFNESIDVAPAVFEKAPEVVDQKMSAGQADVPKPGDDMMEMPGHRWVKIGLDEESVSQASHPGTEDSPEDMMERMAETIRDAADMNNIKMAQKDADRTAAECDDGEEQVYNLFELGAIEFVEQTPSQ